MPVYTFKCRICGHADDEYQRMSAANTQECPACHAPEYHKQVSLPHTDLKEYHTPIEMLSIAMEDREEIRAFKQRCPHVDLSDDPRDRNYGVPVARTRKAKREALAAAGYVERS